MTTRIPCTSAYCSRDVLTEPPTTVTIVLQDGPKDVVIDAPFQIQEVDVEPTDGWRSRFGKSQLSICFMHSFGKCSGRVAGEPSSCHQIHIRPEALKQLRSQYKHKVRSFFCRTIKAHLQQPLREMLSRIAKKDLTLKYLEYRTQDVEPTEALYRYEAAYRNWLQSDSNQSQVVPFPDAAVEQCTAFAVEGVCPKGTQCNAVHCHVAAAQVRDRAVATALQQLHRPPSFASFVQQQYPVYAPAAAAPVYVVVLQQPDMRSMPPPTATVAGTPPSAPAAMPMSFLPKDLFGGSTSRAMTPNADNLSSAGALTPSHSSGAFDRNTSSAYFTMSDSTMTPQMSLMLPPNQQQQNTSTTSGSQNDIFQTFRNHFNSTQTPSQ